MSTIFLSFLWKWKKVKVKSLSRVQLFMTPWTHQAPLSMGFSRQEYWSGLPFPSPIISLVLHNSSVTIISHFLGPSLMMPWNFINPPQKTWITVLSRFSRVWLCLTLCDSTDCSLPGSLCPWDPQGTLVAISFSRGSSQPTDRTSVSYISCTGRRVLYH